MMESMENVPYVNLANALSGVTQAHDDIHQGVSQHALNTHERREQKRRELELNNGLMRDASNQVSQ